MPYMTPTTNFAGQVQPNSWAGKAGNALTNNSGMLTALGLGLLDKWQNNQVSYSQIGTQALAGSQYDQNRREREEESEAKNMMADWLVKEKGLSRQDAHVAIGNPAIMADFLRGKPGPISVGKNETLLDPDTFEPVYSSPEEPETSPDIRTYQFYANEELRANRQPLPMLEWQKATKSGGVTVNTGDFKVPKDYQPRGPDDPRGPGVEPIEGGPAEQLPAELAARIGLANNFLKQAPELRAAIAAGEVTGPVDQLNARQISQSDQASVYRKIESGTDALRRMLTGAGMPAAEASDYVRRYLPDVTDDAVSAADKLDQLVAELESMKETAMRGRGGSGDGAPPGADLYDKYGLER